MAKVYAGNTWKPAPGVTVLERYDDSGWGWNSVAVELPRGGLAVYSPAWLGDDTFARLDALGEVKLLIIPSHFHHLAVPQYRARYPKARGFAATEAHPRLIKNGHTDLEPLDAALPLLPPGSELTVIPGFKTGEAWWTLPTAKGPVLVVCDAFMRLERKLSGAVGFGVRYLLGIAPGNIVAPGTLKWLHLKDRKVYVNFARGHLARVAPSVLVTTHGAPQTGPDLAERLEAVLKRL